MCCPIIVYRFAAIIAPAKGKGLIVLIIVVVAFFALGGTLDDACEQRMLHVLE